MNEMINGIACCCSLPYYNPDACKNCSVMNTYPYQQQWYPKIKNIKRVTKTIEKYDKDGKLIGKEVITKEYEDIEQEVWEPNRWVITYDPPPIEGTSYNTMACTN